MVWIIVMFLSAVWTLILTAPIHCCIVVGSLMNAFLFSIVNHFVSAKRISVMSVVEFCGCRIFRGCLAIAGGGKPRVPSSGEESIGNVGRTTQWPENLWQHYERLQVTHALTDFKKLIYLFCKDALKWSKVIEKAFIIITFTFSHLADAFIQSDLQLGNT